MSVTVILVTCPAFSYVLDGPDSRSFATTAADAFQQHRGGSAGRGLLHFAKNCRVNLDVKENDSDQDGSLNNVVTIAWLHLFPDCDR